MLDKQISCPQVKDTMDAYKDTQNVLTLTNFYDKERCGWRAFARANNQLTWTLVPPNMRGYVSCMEASRQAIGDPEKHIYMRDHEDAVAARECFRPSTIAPSMTLGGLGSPKSFKRRRV